MNAYSPRSARTTIADNSKANKSCSNQAGQAICVHPQPINETFWTKTTTDPVAAFTATLALATILLWVFTALLWRSTRNAIVDSKAATRAAQESVSQATEGNSIARATAQHELRAYVSIADDGLEPNDFVNNVPGKVIVKITNFGQTPAVRCTAKVSIAVGPYDKVSPVIPEDWDKESVREPRDIPPRGEVIREVTLPGQALMRRWGEMERGTDAVFVRVEITYSTIFEERYRQTTVLQAHGERYKSGKLNTVQQSSEEHLGSDGPLESVSPGAGGSKP